MKQTIKERKNEYKYIHIVDLIMAFNFASSRSEARRLIKQGAVSIDNKKITSINTHLILPMENKCQRQNAEDG
tara:strand:- start:9 stop:227 length:219 start_codon:yes stop_codon:yes gene_type:complete